MNVNEKLLYRINKVVLLYYPLSANGNIIFYRTIITQVQMSIRLLFLFSQQY